MKNIELLELIKSVNNIDLESEEDLYKSVADVEEVIHRANALKDRLFMENFGINQERDL